MKPLSCSSLHTLCLAVLILTHHRSYLSAQTDKKGKKEHSNQLSSLPLIAVMAATTTRKINKPSTKNLSLFMYLLPSLIRTLDCGFRYEYVLGYDKGDPFYDSAEVSV